MSEKPAAISAATPSPPPIYVVDLWGQCEAECGICEEWGQHRHAIGWYCSPVKEDIGEPVPEWGPDAIAAGRTVCKACHDRFYGIKEDPSALPCDAGETDRG